MAKDGWAWPLNSRKAHYFIDTRSLCRRWSFWGSQDQPQHVGAAPQRDDCVPCWRAAKKMQDAELREHTPPAAGEATR